MVVQFLMYAYALCMLFVNRAGEGGVFPKLFQKLLDSLLISLGLHRMQLTLNSCWVLKPNNGE